MNPSPRIVLVLGTTFTGKSWAAGWLCRWISRPFVVVVHTHQDTSYLEHLERGACRFVAVTRGSFHVSAKFLEETRARFRYLWLSVYDLDPEQVAEFLSSVIEASRKVGDLALFIDEAHLFCSRFQVPRTVAGFIRGARFYGVDVVLVTHRLVDIDPGIRCVLTHLILFRSTEGLDVQLLAKELGLGAAAEKVRALPDRFHLFVNRRTGTIAPPRRV